MIPEIENSKEVNFNKTEEDIKKENERLEIDKKTGHIIRNSHSHYYGYMVRKNTESIGKFSLPESFSSTDVYLKKSKIYGYGVFSSRDIKMGETIEETLAIILDTTENTINDWVLNRHAREWECDCEMCKTNGKTMFIAPGYVMMYNHSQYPNAHLLIEKPFKRVKIIALRDIEKDEEITLYYGESQFRSFERQKKLDKRNDVSEGIPATYGQGGCTSCSKNKENIKPQIIKGNDDLTEFRGRNIDDTV
jgi:hypothetical protein